MRTRTLLHHAIAFRLEAPITWFVCVAARLAHTVVRRGAGDNSAPPEKGVTWGPAAAWPPQPITEHGQPREIDDPKVPHLHASPFPHTPHWRFTPFIQPANSFRQDAWTLNVHAMHSQCPPHCSSAKSCSIWALGITT